MAARSQTDDETSIPAAVVQYALEPLAVELREIAVPEIGEHDVLLAGRRRLGVRLGRAPVPRHAFLGGERAGRARPRVLRHGREGRARGARGSSEGDRVVSETAAVICGDVPDVPHRPLQPVPDAQGLRLRHQRRDGVLRERRRRAACTRSPTRCRSSSPACAEPHAVAYNVDVRQLDDPSGRSRRGLRPRPDRPAVRADGGARRRQPADRRRAAGRTRRGSRRRRALGATHVDRRASRGRRGARAQPRVRSAPISSATRRAPAGRSTRAAAGAARTAR